VWRFVRNKREICLLAVLLTLGAILLCWPYPEVSSRGYYRLRKGMSRAEVIWAIGGLPGNYTTAPTFDTPGAIGKGLGGLSPIAGDDVWEGDEGMIYVHYDSAGRAEARGFISRSRVPQGMVENICWRIDRWWGNHMNAIRD
jgi:hypothetical protein